MPSHQISTSWISNKSSVISKGFYPFVPKPGRGRLTTVPSFLVRVATDPSLFRGLAAGTSQLLELTSSTGVNLHCLVLYGVHYASKSIEADSVKLNLDPNLIIQPETDIELLTPWDNVIISYQTIQQLYSLNSDKLS